MELKYIVMTIIKILISVPAVLLTYYPNVNGAALMGGHLNNTEAAANATTSSFSYFSDYDYDENGEDETMKESATMATTTEVISKTRPHQQNEESGKMPNSSPLVLPGYNLPDNLFNKGKPFYLDIDPTTGHTEFNHKLSSMKTDSVYDEDEISSDIFNKANIDRKDGSLSNHKPSDVNQLSPTFHDYLNLPMKYNVDKYVYPLISSSYANTKVQGNINKYYNHRIHDYKSPIVKSTLSPTYNFKFENYFAKENESPNKNNLLPNITTSKPTTIRQTITTTTTTTSKPPSLISSPINHPSYNDEYDYDFFDSTSNTEPNEMHSNAKVQVTEKFVTSTTAKPSTTTKHVMSLYEQLFGDYEEETTTRLTFLPSTIPSTTASNKYDAKTGIQKDYVYDNYEQHYQHNKITNAEMTTKSTGTDLGLDNNYEYEDEYDIPHNENFTTITEVPAPHKIPNATKSTTKQPTIITTPKPINKITRGPETSEQKTTMKNTTKRPVAQIITTAKTASTTITSRPVTSIQVTRNISATKQVPVNTTTAHPFSESHIIDLNNHQSIIVTTENLTETLNKEIEPKPFGYNRPLIPVVPSANNIHIPPHQDTVSFVVGHYQNAVTDGYDDTLLHTRPYTNNIFRPLYKQGQIHQAASNNYNVQNSPHFHTFLGVAEHAVTVKPSRDAEASLVIGNSFKQKPGNTVNVKFDMDTDQTEPTKTNGSRIVFPDEKEQQATNYSPPLYNSQFVHSVPHGPAPPKIDVLSLHPKPIYQLPSDLTPPKEHDSVPPPRMDRPRPPWDPRPGHFYAGKPEYTRPPRPSLDVAHRRIDSLPNILPQFRPNMNIPQASPQYPHFDRFNRQPLLDRPSNRPIAFFERLHPPPPLKNLHTQRKSAPQQPNINIKRPSEYHILDKPTHITEQYDAYQTPPKFLMAKRRNSEDEEVETLQMIHVKKAEKIYTPEKPEEAETNTKTLANDDNSLYVVYPVNSTPLKLDAIDSNKKESVVIGTRAEIPLPPSKIRQQNDDKNPLLHLNKSRIDSPVLRPHFKPPMFSIKSDFPYPLEIPDSSMHVPPVILPSDNGNNLEESNIKYQVEHNPISPNNWNTVEENMENHKVSTSSNQISVTLRTYTETPIAVAYRPTEPHKNYFHDYVYSMPAYGSPTNPKIKSEEIEHDQNGDSELLLKKTIHVQPHLDMLHKAGETHKKPIHANHRIDMDTPNVPVQQEFQAPFQASINIDSSNSQGWFVIRDKKLSTSQKPEVTTPPLATTSEFDIENFKPQLEGGFKPIYTPSNDKDKLKITNDNDNQEK